MLVVEDGEGGNAVNEKANLETSPVKQKDFGEYVTCLVVYILNNSVYIHIITVRGTHIDH